MSYANITFNDKNYIKRWLQKKRLTSAMQLVKTLQANTEYLCDFGAGNGELSKLLNSNYKNSNIVCYEPAPILYFEAQENLKKTDINIISDINQIKNTFDVLFCLEVFEHLPEQETKTTIQQISTLLKPNGIAIIGVPIEIGIPALYKGCFRMFRRFGAFDANLKNIFSSFIGIPPKERPIGEIAPGLRYHFEHVGFDYRTLKKTIQLDFKIIKSTTSPFSFLGKFLMPELNIIIKKT